MRVWHKIAMTLEMVKWEHSIFAVNRSGLAIY
jgi:hypothetical protein